MASCSEDDTNPPIPQGGNSEPQFDNKDSDVIEIKERVFIAQINDIYSNFADYEGKTIIVEGMYSEFQVSEDSPKMPVVYRKGPGCCGNDGWGGFFLRYDGQLPKENDWIRVQGKPLIEEGEDGYYNLFLQVDSLEVKKERGAETVKQ